jgi:methionine-rich copper-binding protein CopC
VTMSPAALTSAMLVAFLASAALWIRPNSASGHAAFVSAEPEPGTELSSAPGVVVLTFWEPLIKRLSAANLAFDAPFQIEPPKREGGT